MICASLTLLHPLLSLTHWIFRSLMLPYKSSSHSANHVRCASLRSRGIKKGSKGAEGSKGSEGGGRRRTSPAQRYYITPEGGALRTCPEGEADSGQNPGSPGPKGPAAASTLARGSGRQPSGIQSLCTYASTPMTLWHKKIPGFLRGFFHWFQASISTVSGRPASSRPR